MTMYNLMWALIWFSCTFFAGIALCLRNPEHERTERLYWFTGMYLAVLALCFVLYAMGWIG